MPEGPPPAATAGHDMADRFADLVVGQRVRLEALRAAESGDGGDLATALTELDVAHEELDVAQDELRAQQEEVDRLLRAHTGERAWGDLLSLALPVSVLVTDVNGTVLRANQPASAMFGLTANRLVRKPLAVLVAPVDRRALRGALSALSAAGGDERVHVTLTPRTGDPVPAVLIGLAESTGAGPEATQVRWLALPIESPAGATNGVAIDSHVLMAEAITRLARLPVELHGDDQTLLRRVADTARFAMPAADGVSVVGGSPVSPAFVASESQLAQDVDGLQARHGHGPSSTAYETGEAVLVGALAADDRWPALRQGAAELGVESVLAVPIDAAVGVHAGPAGVITIYGRAAHAFSPQDLQTAELFTSAASAVIQDVHEREDLKRLSHELAEALQSRAVIDQAKGMIMAANRCSAEEAFQLLVRLSQARNLKVQRVARTLVEQHGALSAR